MISTAILLLKCALLNRIKHNYQSTAINQQLIINPFYQFLLQKPGHQNLILLTPMNMVR